MAKLSPMKLKDPHETLSCSNAAKTVFQGGQKHSLFISSFSFQFLQLASR